MKKVLLLSLLFSISAFATEHKLIKITSDEYPKEYDYFVLETNDHNTEIIGMKQKTYYNSGKYKTEQNWPASDVVKKGAVIATDDSGDREVVKLQTLKNFSLQSGGVINLKYLYSGVSGKKKDFQLSLTKVGGSWRVTKQGKSVNKLHFVSNKSMILGTIGIKEIKIK